MKSTLLLIILTISVLHSKSQGIKFYGTDEGVNHEIYMTCVQDTSGNIWFGGLFGIHKWDGAKFTFIKAPSRYETVQNGLITGRVLFLDRSKNVLDYNMNKLLKIQNDKLIEIGKYKFGLVDDMGNFYGIMDKEKKNILIRFDGIEQIELGDVGNKLYKIFKDSKGNIWLIAEKGLFQIHNKECTQFAKDNLNNGLHINAIFEDSKGRLWISADGAYCFNASTYQKYTKDDGLYGDYIITIGEFKDGTIWAVPSLFNIKYSERFNTIRYFNGVKWEEVSKRPGFPKENKLNQVSKPSLGSVTLNDSINISGVIFVAYWYQKIRHPIYSCSYNKNNKWIINDGTVKFTIGDDKYRGKGLFKYEINRNEMIPVSEMGVLSLFESRNGDMWFSSKKELFKYNENIGVTLVADLKNKEANSFFEDKKGNMWVGTYNGIYYVPSK